MIEMLRCRNIISQENRPWYQMQTLNALRKLTPHRYMNSDRKNKDSRRRGRTRESVQAEKKAGVPLYLSAKRKRSFPQSR